VEALFLAHLILRRETEGLLDHYYWKQDFLEANAALLTAVQAS
jgi:ribosome biogenesis protein Tsr3